MKTAGRRKAKVTFTIEAALVERMRHAVGEGIASSQSALVQESVTVYLAARREEALRREYEEAACDPRFLRDIEDVMHDFRYADAELSLDRDDG